MTFVRRYGLLAPLAAVSLAGCGLNSVPTAEENLCKCSGRGILLIEAYMDSVTWSNNGRRLTMVKRNTPE